jgi:hypothetical protein
MVLRLYLKKHPKDVHIIGDYKGVWINYRVDKDGIIMEFGQKWSVIASGLVTSLAQVGMMFLKGEAEIIVEEE